MSDYLAKGDFVYRDLLSPPIFVKSNGSRLIDDKGVVYIDLEAANGTVGLGYDPDLFNAAVSSVSALPSIPSFCETPYRLDAGKKISDLFRKEYACEGKVAFELGGAQGVELAIKIARLNSKGRYILTFEGGYHGRSLYTSWLSSSERYRELEPYLNLPIIRLPLPTKENTEFILKTFEGLLYTETSGACSSGKHSICAFIFEPILNVSGMIFPDVELMNQIVASCQSNGILTIADEVFTGIYRTGKAFGCQHFDFIPDIVVLSKALSNGYLPISCVWGKGELMSRNNFPPGTHSITYGNNTLSMSVINHVLNKYAELNIEVIVKNLAVLLSERCDFLMKSHLIKKFSIIGGIAQIELGKPQAKEIRANCLEPKEINGQKMAILIASTGLRASVLNIHPPLTISKKDLDYGFNLLELAIKDVCFK